MTDINVDVTAKADLEPILKAAPSGIKRVFDLVFGSKIAKNDRLLRLSQAQTDVDVRRVLEGEARFEEGGKLVEQLNEAPIGVFIGHVIDEEEAANLLSCSLQAASRLGSDEQGPDQISREFVLRWRQEAKFLSSEEAQIIWGQILSEEIKTPGVISPRSLETIKTLTQAEAKTFNKACNFVIFDAFLPDSTEYNHMSADEYRSLRDAGLIASFSPGVYRGTNWPNTTINYNERNIDAWFLSVGKYFLFIDKIDSNSSTPNSVSYWELTQAGKELYQVIKKDLDQSIHDIREAIFGRKDLPKIQYTKYVGGANDVDMPLAKYIPELKQ